jgi:hypothetical protein
MQSAPTPLTPIIKAAISDDWPILMLIAEASHSDIRYHSLEELTFNMQLRKVTATESPHTAANGLPYIIML